MEPELHCVGAILSPSTGIIDSHGLMLAYLGDAEDRGAALVDGAELLEAIADGKHLHLVEFAGDLLAVAGDEGHGGALGEE